MNTPTKTRFLHAVIGVGILAVAVLAYNIWQLSNEVEALKTAPPSASVSSAPKSSIPWPENFDPWSGNWDPTGQFAAARKQIDELMNSMLPGNSIFSSQGFGLSPASPRISMTDTQDEYRIVVQVLGEQDIEVNTALENGVLTISGVANTRSEDSSDGVYELSHSSAQFSQSMTFPEPVDESAMKVDQTDDEIVITIPKLRDK